MNITELLDTLEKIFDTPRCLSYLNAIYENDKYFNFSAFKKTADNCAEFMRRAGLDDIEVLPLKADGKTVYGDWVIPQAWDAEYAVLKSASGQNPVIFADYQKTPCSLVMYSAPTPKGGITAEAVILDDLDNADIDFLRGKFIVTRHPAGKAVPLAQKAGALGIISDYIPLITGVRDNLDAMQNVSRWDNDIKVPINDTGLFAFNLSPANGGKLRDMISKNRSEPFYLSAEVETKLYDGECFTVSGKIKGETEDSVVIYGHLYEPGAHDNASGCAVILELAACISDAVKRGVLPKPKRTLNFVVGYECTGSVAWALAKERKAVCGLVADMVGTDKIDNTHIHIWHNPMSNISFADAYIDYIAGEYKKHKNNGFEWESNAFILGTDSILGDPYFNMPTPAMVAEPALSYHSSLDIPERIEHDVITRNGVIAGAYLFGLAAAGINETERLWEMTLEYIDNIKTDNIYFKTEMQNAAKRSITRFCPDYAPEFRAGLAARVCAPPNYAGERAYIVPKRTAAGCLTFRGNPKLADAPWQPAWNARLNLPLFWVDGKRNLWETAALSAAETQTREGACDMEEHWNWLNEYFSFLENKGYLSYQ